MGDMGDRGDRVDKDDIDREHICSTLLKILDLDSWNSFYLCDIYNDPDKKLAILSLKDSASISFDYDFSDDLYVLLFVCLKHQGFLINGLRAVRDGSHTYRYFIFREGMVPVKNTAHD